MNDRRDEIELDAENYLDTLRQLVENCPCQREVARRSGMSLASLALCVGGVTKLNARAFLRLLEALGYEITLRRARKREMTREDAIAILSFAARETMLPEQVEQAIGFALNALEKTEDET